MNKLLIVYCPRYGNTEIMAYAISEGAKAAKVEVTVKSVENTELCDLLEADAIIMGSPTYYGLPSSDIIGLLDESGAIHGKLRGKVGGAFSSSTNIAGGNETTILALVHAMLVHGMIVQGNATGNHYGPVSIDQPNQTVRKQCYEYGILVAELTKKVKSVFKSEEVLKISIE
jgi:NAD(P)H dehydrogenase (quinone)